MFKKLLEISDPTFLRLSNIQKAVLTAIFAAQTPELAYEAALGSDATILARDFLIKNMLITIDDNRISITGTGSDILEINGLMDESGTISETGKKLVDGLTIHKQQFAESLIPYRTLKKLSDGGFK